jgi:hypothetical protein
MNAERITQSLVQRLQADGLQISQVLQSERDGNLEITIQARELGLELGLKSLTVKMEEAEVSRPLIEDFSLIGEDEGFVDHIDYSPQSPRELVPAADEEM